MFDIVNLTKKINKAYKFKLKPNSSQKAIMVTWLDVLRSNYNYCLVDNTKDEQEKNKLKEQLKFILDNIEKHQEL